MKRAAPWLLPVACALVPAVAAHAAWLLARSAGSIPDCIPHLEGCTSISRAARHGSANILFKALMIPAAALQAWNWAATARWIASRAGTPDAARGILPLGIVAGVALAVYAGFLGSEGWLYGWLRRYGITFYFAATFLAMLAFVRQLRLRAIAPRLATALLWTCAAMLALGFGNVVAPLFGADDALRERIRDAMEWQLGMLFTLWFLVQARVLR